MSARSAGLLVYRMARSEAGARRAAKAAGARGAAGAAPTEIEVLVVHPGGPYWARRDTGWWSIPKGEVGDGEDPYGAARREFEEELGVPAPGNPAVALGEVVQAGGKRVEAWAVEGDVEVSRIESGTFEIEWPPRSGQRREFPEVDRAAWSTLAEARRKLLPGQVPLLTRLAQAVSDRAPGLPAR